MFLKRNTKSGRGSSAAAAIAVGLVGSTLSFAAHATAPQLARAGAAVLTAANDPTDVLDQIDSDTPFTIYLPHGAACPGDSFHDNWRVQSYILPIEDDLAAIRFSGVGPEGVDPANDQRF